MRKFLILAVILALALTAAPAMAAGHETTERFIGHASGQSFFDFSNPKGCDSPWTTVGSMTRRFHRGTVETAHCFVPTSPDLSGYTDGGEIVFTSTNGVEVRGTYQLKTTALRDIGDPVFATGDFTITGGTGRYEDATGGGRLRVVITFEGIGDDYWATYATWMGTITLAD